MEMNWSALEAVGVLASAVATFAAVLIALHPIRIESKRTLAQGRVLKTAILVQLTGIRPSLEREDHNDFVHIAATIDSLFAQAHLLDAPSFQALVSVVDSMALARRGPWPPPRSVTSPLVEAVQRAFLTFTSGTPIAVKDDQIRAGRRLSGENHDAHSS